MAIYINGVEQVAPGVDSGIIAIWHGTIANIPAGWLICDGNNGTPNLLTKFLEGVATAATDPGAAGGATAKTTAGHTHTFEIVAAPGLDGTFTTRYISATDSIADIRPLYYDVAYLMKT